MARPSSPPPFHRNPFVVAVAAWALPGLGYALLGQRARGLTIGVSVVGLFVFGLLIGGVRALEVPTAEREERQIDRLRDVRGAWSPNTRAEGSARGKRPELLEDVRAKPWSVVQALAGPVGFAGMAASDRAGRVDPEALRAWDAANPRPPSLPSNLPWLPPSGAVTPGVESHARVNELAILYTAVAGMLNLLAIIDSAHRAGRMLEAE